MKHLTEEQVKDIGGILYQIQKKYAEQEARDRAEKLEADHNARRQFARHWGAVEE